MAKKRYAPEQIINKLREVELLLSQGATIAVASKRIVLATIPIIAGVRNTVG